MAGRPREFDRQAALEKARDAFWRRGYEGTSMADLVEILGLAPARIYAAFGSKEALFREAVAHYQNCEGTFVANALAQEPGVRQAVERMLVDAIDAFYLPDKPRGCMIVSAATNCAASNDGVMNWLSEQRRNQTRNIVARLREGIARGELRPDTNAEAVGNYIATVLNGMSVQAMDGVKKTCLQEMIPGVLRVIDDVRA